MVFFQKISKENSSIIFFLILLYISLIVLMPQGGHESDLWCWKKWTQYIFESGLQNAYDSDTNYMPAFMYVFYLFGLMQGSVESIHHNIYALKGLILPFDMLGALSVVWLIRDRSKSMLVLFALLLNIAYLYNTVIWGQLDAVHSSLCFLSFLFASKGRVWLSLVFLQLALNFKLQSIIFIPPLFLLLLPTFIKKFRVLDFLKGVAVIAGIQLVILLPFIAAGKTGKVADVIFSSVDYYPYVAVGAYNFWYLILDGDLRWMNDTATFLGISYKSWGLLLFCTSSLAALTPLLINSAKQFFQKHWVSIEIDKLLIIFSLISLLFFYFNTQMHERYSHPMFLFLAAYSFHSKKFLPIILGSVAYFLNMEDVLQWLKLANYGTLIFDPRFISVIYLILIIWLVIQLYVTPAKNAFSFNQGK